MTENAKPKLPPFLAPTLLFINVILAGGIWFFRYDLFVKTPDPELIQFFRHDIFRHASDTDLFAGLLAGGFVFIGIVTYVFVTKNSKNVK